MGTERRDRRRAVITGSGSLSPFGTDTEALWQALDAGRSGLGPITTLDRDAEPERLALRVAGCAPFDPREQLEGNFRPIDRTGRLSVIAAQQVLAATGWDTDRRAAHEVGLVLGTMFGSVHTISAFDRRGLKAGPKYVKPLDFANSVINAAAGQTAIWLDLRGINSTVAGGTVAGLQALAQACELVRTGRATTLLAGGAEELSFESFFGFQQAGRTATPDAEGYATPRPFAAGRSGFVPGEGAALLMLEEPASARARGATPVAEITGHGAAFDPSRGRDPDAAARAVARAVAQALGDAGREASEVDVLSTAGSGGRQCDAAEAHGLARALGAERLAEVPATAIKSWLGEGLGASGAFQALSLLGTLVTGRLPGVDGHDGMDPDLPRMNLRAGSREVEASVGLVTAVGLDGGACAVVLERPEIR